MSKNSSQSGYILIDVLVAVTILAIGLVFVVKSLVVPNRAIKKTINSSNANWIIDKTINKYTYGFVDISDKTMHEINGVKFVCKIDRRKFKDNLYKVEIEVTWEESRKIQKTNLRSIIFFQ